MKWHGYFEKTKNRKQWPLLELAVNLIKLKKVKQTPQKAADLGCGTGGDTLYLLEQNYDATAVDAEKKAMEIVEQRAKEKNIVAPKLVNSPIEEMLFSEQFDLMTSNLALPFILPSKFSSAWSKIAQYTNFGGIFSGQFFGPQHQWTTDENMTFHNVGALKDLFKGLFNVIYFFEEKEPVQTAFQGQQFWHQYDVIAIRIPLSPERPLLFSHQSKPHKTNLPSITHQEDDQCSSQSIKTDRKSGLFCNT